MTHCTNCERSNDAAERRMYWNRLPRLIRLERLLKSAALCLLVVAFVVLYRAYPKAGNPKPGFYVMLGFLFVRIAAWQTIGKLTRRGSRLSGMAFWTALLGLSGGYLLLLADNTVAGLLLLAGALVAIAAGRLFSVWKRRLLSRAGPA